jgi:hypothetical protein
MPRIGGLRKVKLRGREVLEPFGQQWVRENPLARLSGRPRKGAIRGLAPVGKKNGMLQIAFGFGARYLRAALLEVPTPYVCICVMLPRESLTNS